MKKREMKQKLVEQAARIVELELQNNLLQQSLDWERRRNEELSRPLGPPRWAPVPILPDTIAPTLPDTIQPLLTEKYRITANDTVGVATDGGGWYILS